MHVALELDYVRELPRGDVRAATDRPPRKTGKRVRVFLCERDRLFQRTAQSMNTGKTPAQRVCREGVWRLRSFASGDHRTKSRWTRKVKDQLSWFSME